MSIDYDITPQRQAYLEARGYTILTACPGSGKTTSIVKKLLTVSHYCEEHYGKHTGFACLSFTNKACAELKQKYMELHDERLVFPYEVLTIDSFIMQYVVLPFWYLCDACKKKPIVVNEASILDRIYYNNILINNKWQQYPIMTLRTFASLMHRKNPSLISKDKAGFKWNHKTITDENEIAYCTAAFTYRLEKGFITSSDALWIACDILDHHQDVAKALVARFPYIIVDEAQDNSELHFEFFKLLKRAGLQNIEFVGDICQSIYGFNNAKPELLQSMMAEGVWNVLPLSECRRSNQRIINLYSKLKSSDVPTITSHDVEDKGIPIVVYKYDDGNVRDVIRDFNKICKDNKLSTKMILARGVDKCKTLAGVKDVDFKYWKSELPYLLIDAVLALESSDMDYAFRKMRLVLSDLLTDNSHDAKRQFIHEIEHDTDWNAKIFEFLKKVPPLSLSFKEWSNQTCSLLQTYWGLENRPEFIPYQKKVGYTMKEMADVPVEQYHQSNDNGSEYYKSVDTIHAVKGATLDAVLLFMSADSRGQSISLKDFPSSPVSVMTESQRMIYVACSRARQFLALAVPRSITDEKIRRALTGVDIDIRNINLQGDLTFTD
ncbi:UvrD-helicase domain-containing protein [Parabacteroides johnsonii]|jgi:superfamily I DNA/RNA helicase|uniref:UvrD-helicase domain-containing protein n=1 Tax=Parabacteroides johnsonii TaxID=387661 RepID=UPI001C8B147F|nr:UvrD-helicase domain-containing protein [Parabacteroides johnsonii]MBX9111004.1 ATP-dependent helicase [Parabacteroides johnsonii]